MTGKVILKCYHFSPWSSIIEVTRLTVGLLVYIINPHLFVTGNYRSPDCISKILLLDILPDYVLNSIWLFLLFSIFIWIIVCYQEMKRNKNKTKNKILIRHH